MNMFKKTGGFTLVELIVVIAILAILAGVAVPAYSGYIQNANKAADTQLLGAINTAFNAACAENGVNIDEISNAKIGIAADTGLVTGLTQIVMEDGTVYQAAAARAATSKSIAPIKESFDRFFAGNENTAFKVIRTLIFDPQKNMFVDPDSVEEVAYSYGGGYVYISGDDAKLLANSTFITAEDLGTEGLLNKVNDVTKFAAGMGGSTIMTTIYQDPAFLAIATEALGLTTTQEMSAEVDRMAAEMLEGKTFANDEEKAQAKAEAVAQIQANAAVLFAAKKAAEKDKGDITEMLTGGNLGSNVVANLKADPAGSMADAALAYGMYTAYAYQSGNADLIANTTLTDLTNFSELEEALNDEEFKKYMGSDQGKADLDAYLSAMNMINSSAKDGDAVTNLMMNGYNDPDLIKLLNQAMGK